MAITAIDRYGAAPGLAPLDRTRPAEPPLAPDLAEITAANNRTVYEALQPPPIEQQRLETLVASARAASVALEARTEETAAADAADEAQAADEAEATDDAQAAAEADDAEAAADAEAADAAAFEPVEAFSTPSAQDVAGSFQAVAALVPAEQTLAPPLFEDDGRLSTVDAVEASPSETDARLRADAPPGELLSRFA